METFKVIKHTNGSDRCLRNVINYPIGKDQVLKEGFGVDSENANSALKGFNGVTCFYDNEQKTRVFHYMASFTYKTAPTAEKAMGLTKEIFADITDDHLAAIGVHNKEREGGSYHSHTAVCPTNIHDGSMLYGDNDTNYALAQRMADVTGEPVKLVVRSDKGKDWECPVIFTPKTDDTEE